MQHFSGWRFLNPWFGGIVIDRLSHTSRRRTMSSANNQRHNATYSASSRYDSNKKQQHIMRLNVAAGSRQRPCLFQSASRRG